MVRIFVVCGKCGTGVHRICNMLLKIFDNDGIINAKPLRKFTTRKEITHKFESEVWDKITDEEYSELYNSGKIICCSRMYDGSDTYISGICEQDFQSGIYFTSGTIDDIVSWKDYTSKRDDLQVIPIYLVANDMIRINRMLEAESEFAKPDVSKVCSQFLIYEEKYRDKPVNKIIPAHSIFINNDLSEVTPEIVGRILDIFTGCDTNPYIYKGVCFNDTFK